MHGIPRIVETQDLPFITISPQCPANRWWGDYLYALEDLVEQAINILPVDPDRIYLTGMSMGGYGTWHLAVDYPQRFAAIAPICGGGSVGLAPLVKDIPIWATHGDKDLAVPIGAERPLIEALQKLGADVTFTVIPDGGHDVWTATYEDGAIYDWLLKHRLSDRKKK